MARPGYVELPGVRLKFRTEGDVVVARVFLEFTPIAELGRLDAKHLGGPGDELYQAWVDLMGRIFMRSVEQAIGAKDGIAVRRAPDYRGEQKAGGSPS